VATVTLPAAQRVRIDFAMEGSTTNTTQISFGVALSGALDLPLVRGNQRGITTQQPGITSAYWILDIPAGELTATIVAGAVGSGGTRVLLGVALTITAL